MDSLPINIADAAVIVVIVFSAVFAFFRGFVHELLAIVSWVGAGVATLYGFPYLQPEARKLISIDLLADMGAGILIFLVVLIALSIATRLLSRRVRDSAFGPLDRSLGLVFGIARGAILVCLAWLILLWVLPREDHPAWITQARTLPLVERGGAALVGLVPERLRHAPDEPSGGAAGAGPTGYQSLLNPPTKGDAPPDKPGYKGRERNAMQRLIEATTDGATDAQEPGQQ